MSKEIINQLETALNDTLALLTTFNEKELNMVPFEGSWTAAQVCRHLLKSETGMDELLFAPSQTPDRNPEERAEELKNMFLNFETKMKSPDFILPEEKQYDKAELEIPLQEAKEKMVDAAGKANLNELAPLPDSHPLHGITKLETVHFITYHTMRHNHQLRKIKEKVQ